MTERPTIIAEPGRCPGSSIKRNRSSSTIIPDGVYFRAARYLCG